jgi:hypothetical protein
MTGLWAFFGLGAQELIVLLLTVGLIVLGAGVFVLTVAVQAKRRGYSLLAWFVAGLLGNPLFLLVLLGILPDFRRKRLRKTEREDLEERLQRARRPAEPAPAPSLERSLGDQATNVPERSLGDEQTRM